MIPDTIKKRVFPEHNYTAVYCNGKTLRFTHDANKPVTELDYPEFYDVKITGKCYGKCSWCYQDSNPEDPSYLDAIPKIQRFFGAMDENQRPFQVAIGGGEPTLHPDFPLILKKFYELGITPNYTTNGMFATVNYHKKNVDEQRDSRDSILKATKEYCGGVAVSCHPHINWSSAVNLLKRNKIKVNLHLIIRTEDNVGNFRRIFRTHSRKVDYVVLLPHIQMGRSTYKGEIPNDYLFNTIEALKNDGYDIDKIAFGAGFYEQLKKRKKEVPTSLYEPEIMSKYLDLKDMSLYNSSFETTPIN